MGNSKASDFKRHEKINREVVWSFRVKVFTVDTESGGDPPWGRNPVHGEDRRVGTPDRCMGEKKKVNK